MWSSKPGRRWKIKQSTFVSITSFEPIFFHSGYSQIFSDILGYSRCWCLIESDKKCISCAYIFNITKSNITLLGILKASSHPLLQPNIISIKGSGHASLRDWRASSRERVLRLRRSHSRPRARFVRCSPWPSTAWTAGSRAAPWHHMHVSIHILHSYMYIYTHICIRTLYTYAHVPLKVKKYMKTYKWTYFMYIYFLHLLSLWF